MFARVAVAAQLETHAFAFALAASRAFAACSLSQAYQLI
jgi:hypothetical protein